MARVRLEFVKIAHLEFVDMARPEFVDMARLLCHMSNAKHMEDAATNTRRFKKLIHNCCHFMYFHIHKSRIWEIVRNCEKFDI